MIARVSKNFKGSICLPSVSQKGMIANQTFYIDDLALLKPDVQNALSKKMIIPVGDAPKPNGVVYITNIIKGSISVPGVGIIRAGETRSVVETVATARPIEEMKNAKIIRVSNKSKVEPEKRKRGRPRKTYVEEKSKDEWNPITWNPLTEDGQPACKPLPVQIKVAKKQSSSRVDGILDPDIEESGDMIFDPNEVNDDDGSIVWVDHEENQKRIAAHPILGKRNADNRKRKHQTKEKR